MSPALTKSVSKSESIRQIGREIGPSVRPRDVISRLAKQGITVSSAQVSTVLAADAKNRRRQPGRRAAVAATVVSTLTLDSLLAAKKLVNQVGSVEAAKTAVDALARLS